MSHTSIELERRIHMLAKAEGVTEQTSDILLHQIRPNLRYNTVSPLAALAALQRELGVGVRYLSKERDLYLNDGSIMLWTDVAAGDMQYGYLCGAEASRVLTGSSTRARLLRFEDLPIELSMAVRAELEGLGHLFALTVGAALHVVNTAGLHTH